MPNIINRVPLFSDGGAILAGNKGPETALSGPCRRTGRLRLDDVIQRIDSAGLCLARSNIRNIVLNAAFLAAEATGPV
ncbi:MAG: hypothetical protein MN733_24420, partial [Nitrososphaera sp.]|nr:hypothetical protein [Nitrososphaera sp.]